MRGKRQQPGLSWMDHCDARQSRQWMFSIPFDPVVRLLIGEACSTGQRKVSLSTNAHCSLCRWQQEWNKAFKQPWASIGTVRVIYRLASVRISCKSGWRTVTLAMESFVVSTCQEWCLCKKQVETTRVRLFSAHISTSSILDDVPLLTWAFLNSRCMCTGLFASNNKQLDCDLVFK